MCHNNNSKRRYKNISRAERMLIWLNSKRLRIYSSQPMRQQINSQEFLRTWLNGLVTTLPSAIKKQHLAVCPQTGQRTFDWTGLLPHRDNRCQFLPLCAFFSPLEPSNKDTYCIGRIKEKQVQRTHPPPTNQRHGVNVEAWGHQCWSVHISAWEKSKGAVRHFNGHLVYFIGHFRKNAIKCS